MDDNSLLKKFSLTMRMGTPIEVGPPLSTILGNIANFSTAKLSSELNEFTNELPNYMLLEVKIFIFLDKTYQFIIFEPSISSLLRLLSVRHEIKIKGSGGLKNKEVKAIKLKNIFLISYFKYGNCDDYNLKMIWGTANSFNLYVIN